MAAPVFDTHAYAKALQENGLSSEQIEAHLAGMRVALENLPTEAKAKLDSTDYENIYLQTRNRLWRYFVPVLGILGAASIWSAIKVIDNVAERAVAEYVQTDRFQKSVLDTATTRLVALERSANVIEQRLAIAEKRATALPNLPMAISSYGVAMAGKNGERFYIETGAASSGDIVRFKHAFKAAPMVVLRQPASVLRRAGPDFVGDSLEMRAERAFPGGGVDAAVFVDARPDGFIAPRSTVTKRYEWFAIGE